MEVSAGKVLKRGGVYLARLDPAKVDEIGKLRPVVVLTAQDILDRQPILLFVCPLSSRSDPSFASLHLCLPARENLHAESFALIEHCRAIAVKRIQGPRLASLEGSEMTILLHRLVRMIGM